jgi:hypothetical protein
MKFIVGVIASTNRTPNAIKRSSINNEYSSQNVTEKYFWIEVETKPSGSGSKLSKIARNNPSDINNVEVTNQRELRLKNSV